MENFIDSKTSLEYWKSLKPVKSYRQKRFFFRCYRCGCDRSLMLKSINSFPILCRNCRTSDIINSEEVREKTRKTNLMKFGVEYNSKTVEWHNKVRNRLLERYGVEHQSQIDAVKRKIHDTNVRRYGGIGFASNELKEKQISTMIDRYGVYHNMLSEQLKKKCFNSIYENNDGIGMASAKIAAKVEDTIKSSIGKEILIGGEKAEKVAFSKIKFDDKLFDSRPELELYILLKYLNVNFEYHPAGIKYLFDGKEHIYYPDFLIENRYVEIKGRHFFDESGNFICPYDRNKDLQYKAKWDCMMSNKVIIITV